MAEFTPDRREISLNETSIVVASDNSSAVALSSDSAEALRAAVVESFKTSVISGSSVRLQLSRTLDAIHWFA
ncbi:MAG: hypothetical protein RLN87_00825 [Parasphingopyxis sp.]|uniref:hypothetical protein n=1 Tax=Parasphingopyxis sp. TaxID=1920299 RepID=UPI0032EC185B